MSERAKVALANGAGHVRQSLVERGRMQIEHLSAASPSAATVRGGRAQFRATKSSPLTRIDVRRRWHQALALQKPLFLRASRASAGKVVAFTASPARASDHQDDYAIGLFLRARALRILRSAIRWERSITIVVRCRMF